ncbi:unnamed protein product [Lactuca virosa]|uniref:DUF632 domain-containing protein n=1 Tax=Lactuca virosa TaxID=75947 RepID=A0AAU9NPL9_9ASTR|nr:unnamed protein product [Lactuca virosa]
MGATNSKVEEDKALQLCRERKKFVRRALDGRCSLAATHFTYIESLTIIGKALSRFVEPEAPMESSLYTSTNATPEPQTFIEKSLSQFSFSSTMSQHINAPGNLSPSPSPPSSSRYYTNHMKIRGSFSRKVEEKPVIAVMGSVTSSSTPRNIIDEPELEPEPEPETPFGGPESQPWDYFGLSHPIDDGFSPHEVRELNEGVENYKDEKISEMGQESEDEFDEPSTDGLVRSFENVNRVADNVSGTGNGLHSMSSAETEILNGDKFNSPQISPLKRKTSGVSHVGISQDEKIEVVKGHESKPVPKDFISSMREIENLFVRASECGREVPRMLEANKLHFRPIFPGKERGSFSSKFIKACLACGDDPSQVQEEPAQNDTKYLTWPRTTSSRGSSFRHDPSPNANTSQSQNQNQEDINSSLFDNFYMNAGSHASTLDRLYAWEKKLYDEVKANEMIRKVYDQKRKLLRELESNGESNRRIDKTRAIVKDLHWRIGVAIHRIDSISRRIEDLRDKELHPQLEELIQGLRKMWEMMHECHKSQLSIISSIQINSHTKISLQSDSHRQITIYLESELRTLSSSFTKWIGSQKAYVQSLDGWLHKCVPPQQSTKKKRRQQPLLRDYGPPIYVTLGIWLEKLETLPTKEVADSIKDLAAEIDHFIPQEKAQGVNLLNDELLEDRFDRLRLRLEGFLGQLSNFSGLSMEMFTDLQKAIQDRKAMFCIWRRNNGINVKNLYSLNGVSGTISALPVGNTL